MAGDDDDDDALPGPARPVGISLTKRFATCWLLPLLLPGSVQLASVRPSVRAGRSTRKHSAIHPGNKIYHHHLTSYVLQ
jgi:hypothetical protein